MKKSNKPVKIATEKQKIVKKEKVEKSISHPPIEDVYNPIKKTSENESIDATVTKSSKINNTDNFNFDKDILNEDIDISPTDISGFDDDVFDNETDYFEKSVDDF